MEKIRQEIILENSLNIPSKKEVSKYYGVEVSEEEYKAYKETLLKKQELISAQLGFLRMHVDNFVNNVDAHIQNAEKNMHHPSPHLGETFREEVAALEKQMKGAERSFAVMSVQKDLFTTGQDTALVERQAAELFDEISTLKSGLVKLMLLGYAQSYSEVDGSSYGAGGIWQLSKEGAELAARYARDGINPAQTTERLQSAFGEIPEKLHPRSFILNSGMAAVTTALQQAKYVVERDGGTFFLPPSGDVYYETSYQRYNIIPSQKTKNFEFKSLDKVAQATVPIILVEKNSSSIHMVAHDLEAIVKAVPNVKMIIVDCSLAVPGTDYSKFLEAVPDDCTVIMLTSLQKLYQLGDDAEQGSILTIMKKNSDQTYVDRLNEMRDDLKTIGALPKPSQVAYWSLVNTEAAARYGRMVADNTKLVGSYLANLAKGEFKNVISEVNWAQEDDGSTTSPVVMIKFNFVEYFGKAVGDAKKDFEKNEEIMNKFRLRLSSAYRSKKEQLHVLPGGDSFGFQYFRTSGIKNLITGENAFRFAPGINNPVEVKVIIEIFEQVLREFCQQEKN